jgi:hypothetical protein
VQLKLLRPIAAIAILTLMGCSDHNTAVAANTVEATTADDEITPADQAKAVAAMGATGSTAKLLIREAEQNELCRGGNNTDTSPVCKLRDKLDRELTARGWCYGEDAVDGASSHWAKCKSHVDSTPDGVPNGSAKLVAYEKHIEQTLADQSNARILAECGWRKQDWYAKIEAILDASLTNDPSRPDLNAEEEAQLAKWKKDSQEVHVAFVFGGKPENRCASIKAEPWQDRLDRIEMSGAI